MKDAFERFIDDNRDAFDMQMPSEVLWDRIALEADIKEPVKRTLMVSWLKTAVAVALVITVTSIGWKLVNRSNQNQMATTLSPFEAQLNEATSFYEQEINAKKQLVYELTSSQPAVREDVDNDLAGLDSAMVQLKADLKDNVANAEVLEAMIQNYRLKLQILEQMLTYIKPAEEGETKKTNNEVHEL